MSVQTRIGTVADLDGLTTTLTAAFERDPLWSWAFPDPEDLAVWWRFYIRSALRYPSVRVTGECAAAAVWIPPDGTELTEEEEERVAPLIRDLIGPRAEDVMELLERFEASHPRERPHYYLSLLGTHPDHRGQGLGMALLAESLGAWTPREYPHTWSRPIQGTTLVTSGSASDEWVSSRPRMENARWRRCGARSEGRRKGDNTIAKHRRTGLKLARHRGRVAFSAGRNASSGAQAPCQSSGIGARRRCRARGALCGRVGRAGASGRRDRRRLRVTSRSFAETRRPESRG